MAFRVLYDASAIFGALQRSILIRVGEHQVAFNLRVLMTEAILDEMTAGVQRKYADFSDEQAESLRSAMISAVPDCLVIGYEHAMRAADISDPDDRHVLGAAIHARVQVIVTEDRDFDREALNPHDIEAQNPDDFLTDLYDLNEKTMRQIVAEEAAQRQLTVDALADILESRGLIRFSQHLRR